MNCKGKFWYSDPILLLKHFSEPFFFLLKIDIKMLRPALKGKIKKKNLKKKSLGLEFSGGTAG